MLSNTLLAYVMPSKKNPGSKPSMHRSFGHARSIPIFQVRAFQTSIQGVAVFVLKEFDNGKNIIYYRTGAITFTIYLNIDTLGMPAFVSIRVTSTTPQ